MNSLVVKLIKTMNPNEIKEIYLSLAENERYVYCLYIQQVRKDLILFCKDFKEKEIIS